MYIKHVCVCACSMFFDPGGEVPPMMTTMTPVGATSLSKSTRPAIGRGLDPATCQEQLTERSKRRISRVDVRDIPDPVNYLSFAVGSLARYGVDIFLGPNVNVTLPRCIVYFDI
ncbi:hypothetical protein X777_02903 [Ooceraea biroi]|uniref:Uncharacterized protein n=1 Tax=Ooceraea biroi TaxID=2015173 RepID=A0A026WME1_OOCBI|nr:hypothetical protein X777_02903 [Ooceraea biroi]